VYLSGIQGVPIFAEQLRKEFSTKNLQSTAVRISPTPLKIESVLNVSPTPTGPHRTLSPNEILEISNEEYIHPHDIFSVFPPRGWVLALEDLGSVKFESQNSSGALSIQVTNTGYNLNDESFERFLEARDNNVARLLFHLYECN